MTFETAFKKNAIAIIGLGKTGLSCAHFLTSQKKTFSVIDNRDNPPELSAFKKKFPHVPLYLGDFNAIDLLGIKQLIISPGISLKEPFIVKAIHQGIEVIGDIELFARHAQTPIIAITGSNAKSTVTTLTGHLLETAGLKVALGGNLGTPALELLTQPSPDYFVLELSSFQLETTFNLKPKVATILNITPDHMDRYQDLSEYIRAKQRIYHQSTYQLVNRQDSRTYPLFPTQSFSFGSNRPKDNSFGFLEEKGNTLFLCFGKKKLISSEDLLIKGRHNCLNALASLALCHLLGIPFDAILPGLKTFPGLAHRCEFIAEQRGVRWYNDSKGTNIGATLAALEGLGSSISGQLIWIAGGVGKNADFSLLKTPVKKYVRKTILIGQDAPLIQSTLASVTDIFQAKNLEVAVQVADHLALPGDVILLSPACASYDMFRNFEHRGTVFKNLVSDHLSSSAKPHL